MEQQHTTAAPRLRFGTLDWRCPAWQATYYPEDLPADWRLGYYANELPAVLLAAPAWLAEDDATLAAWAAEVHDDFRFYLLADAAQDAAVQQRRAGVLGERLGGLLWPGVPAPGGCWAPQADLPARLSGWGDAAGLRLALLDVAGLSLRERRGLLELLAPRLAAGGDTAVIVDDPASPPDAVRELQVVAELLGLA